MYTYILELIWIIISPLFHSAHDVSKQLYMPIAKKKPLWIYFENIWRHDKYIWLHFGLLRNQNLYILLVVVKSKHQKVTFQNNLISELSQYHAKQD